MVEQSHTCLRQLPTGNRSDRLPCHRQRDDTGFPGNRKDWCGHSTRASWSDRYSDLPVFRSDKHDHSVRLVGWTKKNTLTLQKILEMETLTIMAFLAASINCSYSFARTFRRKRKSPKWCADWVGIKEFKDAVKEETKSRKIKKQFRYHELNRCYEFYW